MCIFPIYNYIELFSPLRFLCVFLTLINHIFRSFYSKKHIIDRNPTPAFEIPEIGNVSEDELDNELNTDSDDLDDSYFNSDSEIESETEEEIFEPDSSDEENNDAVPQTACNITNKKKMSAKAKSEKFHWKKKDKWDTPNDSNVPKTKLQAPDFTPETPPIKFVEMFLTDELIESITFHTNLYNTQRATAGYQVAVKKRRSSDISNKKVKPVSISEIKRLIGIILYMGIHKLPNRRLYWGNKTYVPFIADAMTRNRFQEILSILHFNDNNSMVAQNLPNYNRMHKLQPLIDHFRNAFRESVRPETYMAIDEMMIPFKGCPRNQ